MPRRPGEPGPHRGRHRHNLRPCLLPLEHRVVMSLTFPGIAGVTFDTSGDVFVSYDSRGGSSTQQQSVAEVDANGYLVSTSVFGTTGGAAFPGALTTVGTSASLPNISNSGDILELQPNGQLFDFNPQSGAATQYDNLPNYIPAASKVFDVQAGALDRLEQTDQFGKCDVRRFRRLRRLARCLSRVE